MDILKRELAPIPAEAWMEIDVQAIRSLKAILSARKVIDVIGLALLALINAVIFWYSIRWIGIISAALKTWPRGLMSAGYRSISVLLPMAAITATTYSRCQILKKPCSTWCSVLSKYRTSSASAS